MPSARMIAPVIGADELTVDESGPGFESYTTMYLAGELTDKDGWDEAAQAILHEVNADLASLGVMDDLITLGDFADGELATQNLTDLLSLYSQWAAAGDLLYGDLFGTLGGIS